MNIYIDVYLIVKNQIIFKNSFVNLSNLKELNISNCNIHHQFIESLAESIPCMRLSHLNIKSIIFVIIIIK